MKTLEEAIEDVKREALRRGFRFETVEEGNQIVVRMIRPDGSVAVIASRPRES